MKLIIGTAQFGLNYGISNTDGKTPFLEVKHIVEHAVERGITWFDTACTYGDCQKRMGQIQKDLVNNLNFIAKTPDINSIGSIMDANLVKSSLLQTIDDLGGSPKVLLVHHADHILHNYKVFEELCKVKKDGLVEKIGVTIYTPEEAEKIIKNFSIDVIQFPCSIFNQEFIASGMLEEIKSRGIETHVRSIFLQGILFMDPYTLSSYFDPIKDHLLKFQNFTKVNKISALKIALEFAKWVNSDKIIIGIQSAKHLIEILRQYEQSFTIEMDFLKWAINDRKFNNPANWKR